MKLNIEIETDAELEKKYTAKITKIMQDCIDALSEKCFMEREAVRTLLRVVADAIENDVVLSPEEVGDLYYDASRQKYIDDSELAKLEKEDEKWEKEWKAEEEFREELEKIEGESKTRNLALDCFENSERSSLLGNEFESFRFMIRQIAASAQFVSDLRCFADQKGGKIRCGFLDQYLGRKHPRKPFSDDGSWVDLPKLQEWQFENHCAVFLWASAPEFLDRAIRLAYGLTEEGELSHPLDVLKLKIRGNISLLEVAAERTEWFSAAELAEEVQLPPKHVHSILRIYEDVKIVEIDRKKKPQKFLVNKAELNKMKSQSLNIEGTVKDSFAKAAEIGVVECPI